MANVRQAIRSVPFAALAPSGVDVFTLARFRAQARPEMLKRPLRPAFHSLLILSRGSSRHEVDFVDHRLAAGDALWVRPGQVQRFTVDDSVGELVIFRPDFLIPGTRAAMVADDTSATTGRATSQGASTRQICRALAREHDHAGSTPRPSVAQAETLRHLLSALILSLDLVAHDEPRTRAAEIDSRFRRLLEADFAHAHDVGHYAERLGWSQRSLNRATQASAGESPKQAIDHRLILEARRLLAHSDTAVAAIGRRLGFGDASNFSAFFARQTGEAPTQFRARAG